jgi:hypothetical protein
MPDVLDLFPHLKDLETHQLLARRQDLKGGGPESELSDATLQELVCISRLLRVRGSISKPRAEPSSRKIAPSLDQL